MSIEQFQQYLSFEKKYSAHTVGAYMRDLRQFAGYIETEHGSRTGDPSLYDYQKLDYIPDGIRMQQSNDQQESSFP